MRKFRLATESEGKSISDCLSPKGEFPEIAAILLTRRNKNWLPKIERLIKENENTMIIVGAAHFVGKGGIIAARRAKGFTVEQL